MPKSNSSSPSTLEIKEVDARQLHYIAPFVVETITKVTAKSRDGREYKREAVTIYSNPANQRFKWIPSFTDSDRELLAQITSSILINESARLFTFEKDKEGNYILARSLA